MNEFQYCPVCGGQLAELLLPTEERPRLVCQDCGYILYLNPKVVCGTLPIEDGKVWLLRRGIEPRLGYWTYPAGFLELDESTEEGAVRETREELGCEVSIDRLFGIYSRPRTHVNVVYLATITNESSRPRLTSEAIEVHPFSPDEVPWRELA